MRKVGYKDMRGRFIWPTSVLCETHFTQQNVDRIVELMLAYNATAFPTDLVGEELKLSCVKCEEENATK